MSWSWDKTTSQIRHLAVQCSTIFLHPEFAALMLPDPDAQDVLCAVHGDAQNHIGRLGLVLMVFLHLVVDGVQKYERIHRFQRPVLPRRHLRYDLLADMDKTTN